MRDVAFPVDKILVDTILNYTFRFGSFTNGNSPSYRRLLRRINRFIEFSQMQYHLEIVIWFCDFFDSELAYLLIKGLRPKPPFLKPFNLLRISLNPAMMSDNWRNNTQSQNSMNWHIIRYWWNKWTFKVVDPLEVNFSTLHQPRVLFTIICFSVFVE